MLQDIVPRVSFERLNKLGGSIIVRDVQPQTMRDSSRSAFTEAERIASDKISTVSVRIIQSVEEKWGRRGEQVLYVLLKCIDLLARRILCYLFNQIRKSIASEFNHNAAIKYKRNKLQ